MGIFYAQPFHLPSASLFQVNKQSRGKQRLYLFTHRNFLDVLCNCEVEWTVQGEELTHEDVSLSAIRPNTSHSRLKNSEHTDPSIWPYDSMKKCECTHIHTCLCIHAHTFTWTHEKRKTSSSFPPRAQQRIDEACSKEKLPRSYMPLDKVSVKNHNAEVALL